MGLMAQQSSTTNANSSTTPPMVPQNQSQMGSQSGQLGSKVNATLDQSSQSSSQMGTSNSAQNQKVEGCLSGTEGNFVLTNRAGTTYKLQGENSELSNHVGQEVRIVGTESNAGSAASTTSSTSSEASSNPSNGNTIIVQKVKKISDACPATSGSSPKQ
jgi:hypothetical protein